MDINDLQRAINYIEQHITERIDYSSVAKIAYSSNFHFQKTFSLIKRMGAEKHNFAKTTVCSIFYRKSTPSYQNVFRT